MIPITSKKEPPIKHLPSEADLRVLLSVGQTEAVQHILDLNPELKYKIENGLLVDSVTGAALWLKKFITEDEETLAMKSDAMKLAKIDDEVLITGETGTGKEIIARAMIGDREGKFQRINCAAMVETLIEAELFGHMKGAYTGAESSKPGMILSANGGVMFLDEVGDLPLTTQAKLLNVLQPIDGKRYVRPVGSTDEKEVTCRFVCATHRDLKDMVEKNLFRKDLYARISTFELHIKPLRERKRDVVPIIMSLGESLKMVGKAKEFIEKYEQQILDDKLSLDLNVRSLEQFVKRYNLWGRP
jgi:transcriptional regulator with PAS, ATPase and Fis domain